MSRSKKSLQKFALEQIAYLFHCALRFPEKGSRYVYLARKLAMKVTVSLPSLYKRRFCKHCHMYFTSANSRVRTRDGKLVVFCKTCKKFYRRPFRV